MQDEAVFGVARQVFPDVPVDKQSNKYYVWKQEDFFRTDALKRAPGAESAGSGLNLSTSTYYCDVVASHFDIDHQTAANVDVALDLDRAAVAKVTRDILIYEDQDFMTKYFGTGIWAHDTTPAITWDNVNSTPIEDIRARWYVMLSASGYEPSDLTLGPNVYKRLQDHPDILDRIKYTQTAIVTKDLIASVLDMKRVNVLFGVNNSANEGAATGTFAFNAGNHALLSYRPSAPGLMVPSAGYTFIWTTPQNNAFPIAIARIPILFRKVERIEGETAFSNAVTAKVLGEFLSSAVAS
jgi:hypothetical protein